MCKKGDIILIEASITDEGYNLPRHSFIVIEDEKGEIKGLDYDFATTIISSFNKKNKEKKLSYPFNLEIPAEKTIINSNSHDNKLDGFTKAEQIYFFKKDTIEFKIIGHLEGKLLELLLKFIENIPDIKLKLIIENL